MKKLIFIFLLFVSLGSIAQTIKSSTIGAGGATVNSQGKYYSHVIGQQSISGTSSKNGVTLRQGFKQPNFLVKSIKKSGLDIKIEEVNPITYTIFPNPFKEKFTIKFSQKSVSDSYVVLYDLGGNVIFEKTYPADIDEINVNSLSQIRVGNYILNIVYKGKPFSANLIKEL
jgi:hypothetical protein